MAATSVVPVDLNAFILKVWVRDLLQETIGLNAIIHVPNNKVLLCLLVQMELDITFLANVTGESSTAEHFTRASKARQTAMNSVFWNEEMGQWLDYWINTNSTSQVVII